MGKDPKLTHRALKLLHLLLQNVQKEYAGAELIGLTGIPSGRLYPLLLRFEERGLLQSRWEELDPRAAGRPRRRYYRLTAAGVELAQQVLGELALPPKALRRGWGT
jgi:DNA-binding PadR family transcriptional regulator